MTLDDFLRPRVVDRDPLPALPASTTKTPPARAGAEASERVREVRQGVWNVTRICRQTETLLAQMAEHIEDQPRVNRLIGQTDRLAREIASIQPGYALSQRFNQMGVFNRSRDDRAIMLDDLSPIERQRRQIERDIRNVRWLGEAADRFGAVLDAACVALRSGEKITRDLTNPSERDASTPRAGARRATGVGAVILADTASGALGGVRDLAAPIGGTPTLRRTVERLARCERLEGVTILTENPALVERALEGLRAPFPVVVEHADLSRPRESMLAVRAGRLWARDCWRAGIAGLSVFDEVADPALVADALESRGLHAALLVGADWCFVDPELCDAVIARHEESPRDHRLVFTQASPGLCGCVIDSALLREIGEKRVPGAIHASIGALLAYNPRKARQDPIGKPICVGVDPLVRDAQTRFIADDANAASMLDALARSFAARGLDPALADAKEIVGAFNALPTESRRPHTLTLRLDDSTTTERVQAAVRAHATPRSVLGVTLDARDMRDLSRLPAFASVSRQAGAAAIHVRADLREGPAAATAVLATNPEVVSVEMHADSADAYRQITGVDGFPGALGALETLARDSTGPVGDFLIVPPHERDATHDEIESFADKWTLVWPRRDRS